VYLLHIVIYKTFVDSIRLDFNTPRVAKLNWEAEEFVFISKPKLKSSKESYKSRPISSQSLRIAGKNIIRFLDKWWPEPKFMQRSADRGLAPDILQLSEEVVTMHNTSAAKHLLPGDFLEMDL
jgi:hypothetical protein